MTVEEDANYAPVPDSPLREKEAFNFALFQHNPAAIVVVDRAGCVVKSNLARRATGDPLPDIGAELFSDDPEAFDIDMRSALVSCIGSGLVREFPELRCRDRFCAITIAPFFGGALVISQDITAIKEAEAEAERDRQQLIQAQKMAALGTLLSGVAHEVSNPNNILLLTSASLKKLTRAMLESLDGIAERVGDFPVGQRSYSEVRTELPELVEVMERGSKRIQTLVEDLKTFARKDDATRAVEMDVNAVVQSAASLLGAVVRKSTDHFREDYAEELPPALGSAQRIEQVIINLLSNACQALESKVQGIVVSTTLGAEGDSVVITVSDEGRGISEDDMTRIKDPFYTTRHDEGGTGLGLSISDTIVKAHGGTLDYTSRPHGGTTATIELPVVGAGEEDAGT